MYLYDAERATLAGFKVETKTSTLKTSRSIASSSGLNERRVHFKKSTMALSRSTSHMTLPSALLLLVSLASPCVARAHELQQTCSWAPYGYPLQPGPQACAPEIDQRSASRAGTWVPWSERPWCIKDPESPHYCVYSHRSFRGGAGISLVTTPDLAASIVPALDDTIVPPSIRDHAASQMGAPPNPANLKYKVVDLPGRGKGTIATKKIKALEVVLVDFPAMILPMQYHSELTEDEQDQVLERSFEGLPEETQTEILGLAASTGGELLADVLRTNIFGIEVKGVQHMGLFPGASRVNHHCKPTCYWRYNQNTLAQEVVAIRDIEPGEEITHSYAPLGNPREYRHQAIEAWGFNCSCSLCTASPREVSLSDRRRYRLHDIHMGLVQYASTPPKSSRPPPPPPPKIPKADDGDGDYDYAPPPPPEEEEEIELSARDIADLTMEMEQLVHAEELWPQLCEYYKVVARAYIRNGSLKRGRMYVEMAEGHWVKYGGVEHDDVEGIRELWAELREAEEEAAEE